MKTLISILLLSACSLAPAQQWVQTASAPKGSGVTDLAVNQLNGDLYATTGSFNWPNADTGGVHRSTDRGDTWARVFRAFVARSIAVRSNGEVFASVWNYPVANEGLYRSTDNGAFWELAFTAGPSNNVFSIAFDSVGANPNIVYAGSRFGVHRSLTGGGPGTWTLQNAGLPATPWIRDLAVAPNGVLIAAVMNVGNPSLNGVYYSTDQGNFFVPASGIASGDTVASLTVLTDSSSLESGILYWALAGTERGKMYRAGVNAFGVQAFSPVFTFGFTPGIPAMVFVLFAALAFVALYPTLGSGGGIAFSSDLGLTWFFLTVGLPLALLMSAVAYHRSDLEGNIPYTLYSGAFLNQNNGAPVYRIDLTTGVKQTSSGIPETATLHQNYPNPFNPTTEIGYRIPDNGHVGLKIYDALGREIATLVNQTQTPGSYEVGWDASGQPSGVYFYRLTAGSFTETRKLMLVR